MKKDWTKIGVISATIMSIIGIVVTIIIWQYPKEPVSNETLSGVLSSDKQYKHYSQYPMLPDFYDVVGGSAKISFYYYDPETDDLPLTWHYRVESDEIAKELIEKYENVLLDGICSKLDVVGDSKHEGVYLTPDKSLAIMIWINETSDNLVFINISITELTLTEDNK